MCERILEGRKRKNRNEEDEQMGFGSFGGYMEAKKSKLLDQFKETTDRTERKSNIFEGVAILVNGWTNPNANELKKLMSEHGGIYHGYQMSTTTHIIASNLAYAKTKSLGSVPIVKASWITDSIELKKLLDYKRYLLFSNQSSAQPKLNFPVAPPTKTASDPEFIQEFYNNSRLHLIATMGSEFKQLVTQFREDPNWILSGKRKLLNLQKDGVSNTVYKSVIMHIDMDCFFVSVGLRDHPELVGKPVVVTHARNAHISTARPERSKEIAMNLERANQNITEKISNLDENSSMSEIACASYEARKFGIKNGMFLGTAIKKCPQLQTIPYNFEGYKEVALKLYETVATYTLDIEAVSCDEMYVDVTTILNETKTSVMALAKELREAICEKTGCTCSCGFGANKLQARMATKKAKPNGVYWLNEDREDIENYFCDISLGDLPGVGRATLEKLKKLNLYTCGDVQKVDYSFLQSELGGVKLAQTILDQCKGIDKRALSYQHERKSVSAEVNYGIRFKSLDETYTFFENLSVEVSKRLSDLEMKCRNLTFKLMIRAAEAPLETAKFLGHGICDYITKSVTIPPTNDPQTIFKNVKAIYEKLNLECSDLRGVGIQLAKLEKSEPKNAILANFLKQNSTETVEVKGRKTEMENAKSIEKNKESNTLLTNFLRQNSSKTVEANARKTEMKNMNNNERNKESNTLLTNFLRQNSSEKIETRESIMRRSEMGNVNNNEMKKDSNTKPKGRGRPPGKANKPKIPIKNGKQSPTNNLNKFLRNMGTPNKINIDFDVLNELPEEIRNEIIKEYKLNQPRSAMRSENEPSEVPSKTVAVNEREDDLIDLETRLFENLTLEELKDSLKSWMKEEEEPREIDVELISEHFRQLAIDRKIENLQIIFNFLHRNFSKLDCRWHQAYFTMVNSMQQGMVARYGGTLLVKRTFSCCN